MQLEPLFRRVDRLAGGRDRDFRVPGAAAPGAAKALAIVGVILVVCLLLGGGTVIAVFWLFAAGHDVSLPVWVRGLVILGITASLFYFLWRAWIGWYWAFRRLQLFTRVFPIIALALTAIPGFFPTWMIVEQLVFAALLVAATVILSSAPIRAAFPKPDRPSRRLARPGSAG
ncbi:hypothetical protein [Microbacterium halophytorum]|uniref:hypothetical protein n=1 Tax=Microbacterium halophytorum TaxID=2067568 RepID=UPI001E60220F|nr:hypothetical protein [Microbacterium halophytorum]